jgi:hypothetical protein
VTKLSNLIQLKARCSLERTATSGSLNPPEIMERPNTPLQCGQRQALALLALSASLLTPQLARAETYHNEDRCTFVVPAEQEEPEAIKENMRIGIEEYRKQNWEEARRAFKKVWCRRQNVGTAASLAQVEMKLRQFGNAARHWVYVIQKATPEQSAKRAEAEEQLAECRKHLGQVDIRVGKEDDPDPATTISIDGRTAFGVKPRVPIWLEAGEHTFAARTSAGRSDERKVTGKVLVFNLPINPQPPPRADVPQSTGLEQHPIAAQDHHDSSSARTPVLITGGVLTLVAVGVGVLFKVQAGNAEEAWAKIHSQLEPGSCGGSGEPALCADLRESVGAYDAAQNRATASFITAGVLGAATVATFFLWPAKEKSSPRVGIGPFALPGGHGVQARVGF